MYLLKTEAHFDAAHFLAGYDGKCSNLHGHRWRVVASIVSEGLKETGQLRGMILDFGDFKQALKEIADYYDHALIIEEGSLKETTLAALQEEKFRVISLPFRPTAENLARSFYEQLEEKGYPVCEVEMYETPNNCAVYMREEAWQVIR